MTRLKTSLMPFGKTNKRSVQLQRCDGSRIAVLIPHISWEPFRGIARYERDGTLGNVLRITLDDPRSDALHILFAEDQWQGAVSADSTYGCDYFISLLPEGS
jgi:hypothetical protein